MLRCGVMLCAVLLTAATTEHNASDFYSPSSYRPFTSTRALYADRYGNRLHRDDIKRPAIATMNTSCVSYSSKCQQDRYGEVPKPRVFFSFDSTNGGNVLQMVGRYVYGLMKGDYRLQKMSDECRYGIDLRNGFVTIGRDALKEKPYMKKLSVTIWVNVDTLSHDNTIYGCKGGEAGHALKIVKPKDDKMGGIIWRYSSSRREIFSVKTKGVIPVGKWAHIAAVFDAHNAALHIYVNGDEVSMDKAVKPADTVSWGCTFRLGTNPEDEEQKFDGSMDEFGIYDEALTREHVQELMGQCDFGTGNTPLVLRFNFEEVKNEVKDTSNTGNNGAVLGRVSKYEWASMACGHTAELNQHGYIHVKDLHGRGVKGSHGMTVAAWVQVKRNSRMNVIYGTLDNDLEHSLAVGYKSYVNGPIMWQYWKDGGYVFNVKTKMIVRAGFWTHIAATFNSETGEVNIYMDGENVYDEKVEKDSGPVKWGTFLSIGNKRLRQKSEMSTDDYFEGGMDNFEIHTRVLSERKIINLVNKCSFNREGPYLFFIEVKTGNRHFASTDVPIYIKLFGDDGELGELTFRTAGQKGPTKSLLGVVTFLTEFSVSNHIIHFAMQLQKIARIREPIIRISRDTWVDGEFKQSIKKTLGKGGAPSRAYCIHRAEVYGRTIGKPIQISVRKEKEFLPDKWYLEKVTLVLQDRNEGPVYTFPYNDWISNKGVVILAEPQVHGSWSTWSSWGGCGFKLCGGGKKVRTRSCTDPTPSGGGKTCEGKPFEEINCPVDGGWGAWTSWSLCSKTCGGAVVTRTRECNSPEPSNGGKPCEPSDAKETKEDCTKPCETGPRDGEWSDWSEWSHCSVTCGGGVISRSRECTNPEPARGGKTCPGDDTETAQDCLEPCPIDGGWGEWGAWAECSKTCGPGKLIRRRKCDNPKRRFGGEKCEGDRKDVKPCQIRKCPDAVNGNWGDWGEWSECTEHKYCNKGDQVRKRKCNSPKPKDGGDKCPGLNSESIECPKENCIDVPKEDKFSKEIEKDSELYYACGEGKAFRVSKSQDETVQVILNDENFERIFPILKEGYFAVENLKKGKKLKVCIEPDEMITFAELKKIYPDARDLPALPDFPLPDDDYEIPILFFHLTLDKKLISGNFLLDSADEYSPKEFLIDNAELYFQVTKEFKRFYVRGFKTVAKVEFDMEVSAVSDDELEAVGTTEESVPAARLEEALAAPTLEDKEEENIFLTDGEGSLDNIDWGNIDWGEGSGLEEEEWNFDSNSTAHADSRRPAKLIRPKPSFKKKSRRPCKVLPSKDDAIKRRKRKFQRKFHNYHEAGDTLCQDKEEKRVRGMSETGLAQEDEEKDEKKETGIISFFQGADIQGYVYNSLKTMGLPLLSVKNASLGINVQENSTIVRATGTAKPILGFEAAIHFEIVKKGIFAVGITVDRAQVGALTKKLFKREINIFGKLRDPAIGFAFAQEGFKLTDATHFTRDPLKSMLGMEVTNSFVIAISAKLPDDCGTDVLCKCAVKLFGENTHIEFMANIWSSKIKVLGRVTKRNEGSNKGKFRLSKIELFMEITYKLTSPPVFGFTVELAIPVEGNTYRDGRVERKGELYVGGTLKLSGLGSLTGEVYMDGKWESVFGISFISISDIKIGVTILLADGIPQALEIKGRLELGTNCYGSKAFDKDGQCLGAGVIAGVNVNPLKDYFFAEFSALTVGKIFRMLGSKLQIPKVVADSGFPEGAVIWASSTNQDVKYNGAIKNLRRGIYFKGMVNILGFTPKLEIGITEEAIFFDAELDPVRFAGGIHILRSLKDMKQGPKIVVNATRKPLQAQVYIHGALKIFGAETETKFNLTMEQIEADFYLNLFSYLKTRVRLSAGYGRSLSSTGVEASVDIKSDIQELMKNATEYLTGKLEFARKRIEDAKGRIKDAKQTCMKKAAGACDVCEQITKSQIQEECRVAMDQFKHFLGASVDKFGAKVRAIGRQVKAAFLRSRAKKYIDLLRRKGGGATLVRRRRFISKLICDKFLGKVLSISQDLCEGTCSIAGHITKGVCHSLDLAHGALYAIERSAYWVQQALPHITKNLLYIHRLSFYIKASPSIDSRVNGSADVTIFQARREFDFEINLEDILENAMRLGKRALEYFMELFSKRFSKPSYDLPSGKSDFLLSGEIKLMSIESRKCVGIKEATSAYAARSKTPILQPCEQSSTGWAFTLTGALMHLNTGECLTFDESIESIELAKCKVNAKSQKFICNGKRVMPRKDKTLCLTETVKEDIDDVSSIHLDACDDEDEEISDRQSWSIEGDPAQRSLCDRFVPDIAFNKPSEQSSIASIALKEGATPTAMTADRAVDGDMSSSLSEGSCIATQSETDPWWRVDLQREYIVTDVSIAEEERSMLTLVETRVGMERAKFNTNPMCGDRLRQVKRGETWTSQCSPPLAGRYVSIQKIGDGVLSICEVAVFARQACFSEDDGRCSANTEDDVIASTASK